MRLWQRQAQLWLLLAVQLWALPALAESAVWQVGVPSGELYIAGSVHVLRKQDYPLPAEFEAAYARADHLVFETDIGAFSTPAVQAQLLARGSYAAGESLRSHLSASTWQRLADYCRDAGLPPEMIARFRPWLAVLTLTALEVQRGGYHADAGLDAYLHGRAVGDGKRVDGLETVDEHLNVLASLAGGLEDDLIDNFLDETGQIDAVLADLIAAWRAGDSERLRDLVVDNMAEYPALREALLTRRNRRWVDAVEKWIGSGERVMIVVGSAHLVGESSLLELLRRRGHQVRKLSLD